VRSVLVIGAGPAGLAAAQAALGAGASVYLVDSSAELGGQFWRHLPQVRPAERQERIHHGWARFGALRDRVLGDENCRVLGSAHVFAVTTTEGLTVHAVIGEPDGVDRKRVELIADAMVIATGAHDRTLPFPGWDLPGVFTAGAAQALAKSERLAVGERVLVAGAGPFLLPVAQSLTGVGAKVLGVLEANRIAALADGWLPRPWQLFPAAAKGWELAGYAGGQLMHRIPYRLGRGIVAAHGDTRVQSVTVARLRPDWSAIPGTEEKIEVDAVCVSHGFTPRLELAIAAGCALTDDRFVQVDDDQVTSVAGVYAAGEVTGIGGVDLAIAEGEIAGYSAATGEGELRNARRRRTVFAGFARRIEAAHGIRPGWMSWLTDQTTVCRCEEVSFGDLCTGARLTGSQSLKSLKLSTRAGLGICQGRICGRSVEQILGANSVNGKLGPGTISDRRPIAVPIRLGELASGVVTAPTITTTDHTTTGSTTHISTTKGTYHD
jgi:NADPH-dependent 2,4-dienoyl-CoA reductase/sulfur reductase-like enzyme